MRVYRIFSLMCIFLVLFTLLLGKIFYYQVICGEKIAKQATTMRSKQITLKEYSRGDILDRNGLALTDNTVSSALYCLPYELARNYSAVHMTSPEQAFNYVANQLAKQINSIDVKELATNLHNATKKGTPLVRVATNLSDDDINKINSCNLEGAVIAPFINRYESNGFCSHIIGYLQGRDKSQGVAGIEKQYDDVLNSNLLSPKLISVNDARGKAIQGLMFKISSDYKPDKGLVVLTIDKRIQKVIEENMDKRVKKGAIVVMDIRSKEILGLASRPSFDPNDMSTAITSKKDSPFYNRALNSYYPGSLFKILVATAALEEGKVSLEDNFNCDGAYDFTESTSISCWKEEGHGTLNFLQAFAQSCNPTFIEVGLDLGRDKLKQYADKLHLTDENINGWLETNSQNSYVKINSGRAGIGNACLGQQGIMLTPVQLTNLIATIANDGKWGPPSITKYSVDQAGSKHITKTNTLEQVISIDTARKVQLLMEGVVTNGTGKSVSLPSIKIAGKTATSQTGNYQADHQEILNTWFGGYFPADNPKWALVVMVEEGTSGAVDAAPIFKAVTSGILDIFSIID
ncbi:MAG TPA: penicillin-binding protein 2 [Syntrophomonadaceae bacterium]|nr:penicillin-binding protein 2 [Syntrophomonadaceae bacterium]